MVQRSLLFVSFLFIVACSPATTPEAHPPALDQGHPAPSPATPPNPTTPAAATSAPQVGGGTAPPVTSSAPTPPAQGQPPPGQWSLKEREQWIKLDEEMHDELGRMNKTCDMKASFGFVPESFRGHFTEDTSYGLTGYVRSSCQSTMYAVASVCARGEMQKKAVQAKVRRVECKYGTAGKTTVELKNGTLLMTLDPDAGGAVAEDATTKYLMNAL